jgi:hypothetical protein
MEQAPTLVSKFSFGVSPRCERGHARFAEHRNFTGCNLRSWRPYFDTDRQFVIDSAAARARSSILACILSMAVPYGTTEVASRDARTAMKLL